jgi:hypothetical protein
LAQARLLPRGEVNGKDLYEIESDPWSGPYPGAPGTSWCAVRIEDDALCYAWHSEADEAANAIRAFEAGHGSIEDVRSIGRMDEAPRSTTSRAEAALLEELGAPPSYA